MSMLVEKWQIGCWVYTRKHLRNLYKTKIVNEGQKLQLTSKVTGLITFADRVFVERGQGTA